MEISNIIENTFHFHGQSINLAIAEVELLRPCTILHSLAPTALTASQVQLAELFSINTEQEQIILREYMGHWKAY